MKTKIILFSFFLTVVFRSEAQTVTIPDTHFAAWLNANIPSAMSGNQMDTSSLDVKNRTGIFAGNDSIQDLSGIQYFPSLKSLDCSGNRITYLPALPDSLLDLICAYNALDSLPVLPTHLTLLNCAGNYLTTLPALPASLTSLTCMSNHLDSLPSLPYGLNVLICSNNVLTALPSLPDSLSQLLCQGNYLAVLATLPDSLITLNCSSNHFTTLPALPSGLTTIDCSSNMLISMPALPAALTEIDCYYNQLTALPSLPASLLTLVCGGNLLTSLPAFPSGLVTLKCYGNQLPVLPVFPSSLTYLDCNSNLLSTLPAIPAALAYINCASNHVTVLPSLTAGLSTLNCSANLLANLPALPLTLQQLDCSANPLAGLPALNAGLVTLECISNGLDSIPSLPLTLSTLNCSSNTLTALPVLPSALNYLSCLNNHLVSLPLLPDSLHFLDCSSNQISVLPLLPARLNSLRCSNNLITCFSVFSFVLSEVDIYYNPFTCLPNYIPAMDSVILNYPLCIDGDFYNNPNGCAGAEGMLGFIYLDNNSNCAKDSIDFNYTNIPVKLYDTAGVLISQTYSASNGVYNFSEAAGTYTIVVDTLGLPFIAQCPSPGVDSVVSVTVAAPLVSNINFDFGCKPGFDVGVRSVLPAGLVFPGQQHQLKIIAGDMSQWYNMHCAAGVGGQVKVTVSGPVTYNGIVPGALSPVVAGNVYTYAISDFGLINNSNAFNLLFTTDTTAAAGSNICVHVDVTPLAGDNDSSNNSDYFCYQVLNSHDPNLKEVFPGDISPKYDDWLTYTIHFQNTGNAPAMNVRIEDTLDSHLDLNTFEVMNYSHVNTVSLNANVLTVRFANIMLPDSATDLVGSQGYVQYRIKPKHYFSIGTQIRNTAYIYFDYNSAVVTNTTTNQLIDPASVNENKMQTKINVFPNPGKGIFNLQLPETTGAGYQVTVYDLMGEIVWQSKEHNSLSFVDLKDQANGIYILKVSGNNLMSTQRLIKQ